MLMASQEEKQKFINQIAEADEIDLIPAPKNKATRLALGLTILDCERLIKAITIDDYFRGPEDDHDRERSGKVWVFKKMHLGERIYIKLKEIEVKHGNKIMECLSWHIDNM